MNTERGWTRLALLGAVVLAGMPPHLFAQQPVALEPARLELPVAFDSAIARGTRTRSGAPGPRYWQNAVSYDIGAQVSPADSLLRGQETVIYRNNSPDTLRNVVFHLYQNLMGPYAAREAPVPGFTQGMVIDQLQANGRIVPVPHNQVGQAPDSTSARVYGTILIVPLAQPLIPGATANFNVRWHFTIPPEWAPRMGMQDATTGQVAQWYPQIAVYDDVHGWDTQQYTGTGEFYLPYGHFRYRVTLPAGYVVGGTGTLTNPEQVLPPAVRTALRRAATSQEVVHVLTQGAFGPGKAALGSAGQNLTWTFDADSVRDVAFSFSDHYLWDATHALVDPARRRSAMVHVLYRPGAAGFPQVAAMARSALETHSRRLVPYPYPQLTQTEGGAGGMEYPMTVFVQAYDNPYRMDEVTAHEIGHEWFPMLVGSNETRYGWQDEGLNTFDTFFATDAFFDSSPMRTDSLVGRGLRDSQQGYIRFVTHADEDLQMMSPSNGFLVVNSGYGVEAYDKPSAALWVLRTALGPEVFDRAYHEYIRRWSYRHPTPWDFFHTMSSVSGQNLDPFWETWFFGRERMDQAVTGVQQANGQVSVTVDNPGGLPAPVDVTATLADGKTVSWREPMSAWYTGQTRIVTGHAVSGPVARVELDAAHNYPDVDRSNNVWAGR